MLNSDQIKGNWKQIKGQLKQKWADLTDDDMGRISSNWQELQGIVQEKYGNAKDKVSTEIHAFEEGILKTLKKDKSNSTKHPDAY